MDGGMVMVGGQSKTIGFSDKRIGDPFDEGL
jgi:hypothetical protein